MRQLPLSIAPASTPDFEGFLPGANAAAVQWLATAPLPGPPIYLWGPPGSGKSHLLHALAARLQREGERIGWFDAADAPPWPFDEGWSMVVVDDVQALDGPRQQAAFALFVEALAAGAQWASGGRLPPVDLPLRDDLRSRLGWGHVFALQPLADEQVRAALRREADHRGIWLSDEVMGYLLTRFERDLKHLMALLDRLDRYGLAERRAVTVPLLRKMLSEQEV